MIEELIFSTIISFVIIMMFILGFVNLINELPNNISNQTILLFVMGFGLMLVNRD